MAEGRGARRRGHSHGSATRAHEGASRAHGGGSRPHGPRPIWNGHLTFGLVSVPVRVLAALDQAEHVGFRLLHRKDHAPIKYKKFCSREDVEVPNDEIVRGYEVEKGTYTEVEGEELQEVQAELGEGQHTIDVLQFVEPASLDPLLFERPYYVVPDEGGEKAYALLRDALRDSGRFAVARLYLRRPLLAAIMPHGDVLALEAMRAFDLPRVAVIALAKRIEEVFVPGRADPILLPRESPALQLLQRIRDEAHRFALTFHRQRRDAAARTSMFDQLEGVGPARRRALLQHFGSAERVVEATQEELEGVPGVPAKTARRIYAQLHRTGRA